LQKPKSVKYRDLVVILEHFGFEQISAKGSHVKYYHPKLPQDLIIPVHNHECKDFYKEQAKNYIENIK
jgi:predicted RNA binding protein YcfA (HicA-like mRNA interferase family)